MHRLMLTLTLAALAAVVTPVAAQSGALGIGMGVLPSNPDPAFDTHSLALFGYNQALAIALAGAIELFGQEVLPNFRR